MYHITKNGGRGYCRAIVRECPLGGESAFFKKMGIVGVARPSAPAAKAMGIYDDVYGKEKSRQDKIKERRIEREKARAANNNTVDKQDNGYTAEYKEKLSNVKKELEEFNNKHSDHLDNSSGYYFVANQKLSPRDEEYLGDLDKVGESVNTLVSDKLNGNTQIVKDKEEYVKNLEQAQADRKEYVDAYRERQAAIKADWYSDKITYNEYSRRFDAERAEFNREIKLYDKKIEQVNTEYSAKYEASYGKAYKEALSDLGVEFANGEEMYSEKVHNQDDVSDDFASDVKSAINYYPEEWVSNIDSYLTVHEMERTGDTLGFVRKNMGRDYELSGKEVELFSSGYSTTVHEFGHVIEINNPEVGRAERLFLIQEKRKSSFKKVKSNGTNQNIATDSLAREYSGVYYKGRSNVRDNYLGNTYEIFTTGVQNLFTADTGGFTTDDTCKSPQHRNFILGLFATTVRK